METIEDLLHQEAALKQRIEDFKSVIEEEKELRKKICLRLLEGKADGTHKFAYQGMAVKVTKSSSYSLDQDEIRRYLNDDDLTQEERDAIRIKYELDLRKYKALTDSYLLDGIITIKDSMPTIEIEFV